MNAMDHAYIEEHEIVDRYVMGTLPPAECEPFEHHYLSCPECLDRLALAEAEQRAFKHMARQEVEKVSATRQLALLAWLARLGRSRQAAVLAMALLVAVLLPWGLAVRRIGQSERELARAGAALEQERQQERQRAAAGSRQATAAAQAAGLESALEASRRELAEERQARAAAAAELARAREPEVNVPILFLNAERDASPAGAPTGRLRLPRAPGWIVLALEIDPPHQPSYRAVLRDAAGRELWRGAGLSLDERDSVSLTLPSTLLAPGDHLLVVEGLAPGEKPVAAGRFAFRVLPPA